LKTHRWESTDLEHIADALAEDEYVVLDDFLSPEEVEALLGAIRIHQEEENFRKAGIGNAHLFQVKKEVRGDFIKWIEPVDALPASLNFLSRIDDLRLQLNRLLFLSLRDFEAHYAIYPKGTFYEAHVDQFQSSLTRKISIACYLNTHWQEGDGGELAIHKEGQVLKYAPLAGRLALFRSDTVLHEVLRTEKPRYSITGWLLDQPLGLPFLG
jgi:SM-20-related protein